jgi:chromosome segregation ATPase
MPGSMKRSKYLTSSRLFGLERLKESQKKESYCSMKLRTIEGELTETKSALEVLKDEKESLVKNREILKGKVSLAEENLSEVTGKYEAIKVELSKAKHQMLSLVDQKAELTTQIDKYINECKQLQEQIAALTTHNKVLDEKVKVG